MKRFLYCFFAMLLCAFCFSACKQDEPVDSSLTSEVQESSVIAFVQNEITLAIGDSVQAEIETSKKNIFVFWSIRDEKLATVSNDGVITALAEGETICYAEFAGERAMCLVKIVAPQAKPLLSISLPYAEEFVTLYVGDSLSINVDVKLGDSVVNNAQLEYEITQTDIAHVEGDKVVGEKAGTTTILIHATYENQNATAILTVNVVEK
ncbi:MAG: Ig-like domain-containing protein [Clostridia bacterium]|nr:Ig-like domain-containing protein [Clostridia bacterium]MBQ8429914.1 Ig-like domain-containing protein [Clostridia bacterium]MBQ8430250.1 Ig-like domain-containing protein [Clostridia bacterium]